MVQRVKNLHEMQETQVQSLGWEDPWREGNSNPFQYSCPRELHGQRRLVGCSSWDHEESDMTDSLTHTM